MKTGGRTGARFPCLVGRDELLKLFEMGFHYFAVKLHARLGSEQNTAAITLRVGQTVVNHPDHPFNDHLADLERQIDDLFFGQWLLKSDGEPEAIEINNRDADTAKVALESQLRAQIRCPIPRPVTTFEG